MVPSPTRNTAMCTYIHVVRIGSKHRIIELSERWGYLNTTSQQGRESEGGRIQSTADIRSRRRSTLTGVPLGITPGRLSYDIPRGKNKNFLGSRQKAF